MLHFTREHKWHPRNAAMWFCFDDQEQYVSSILSFFSRYCLGKSFLRVLWVNIPAHRILLHWFRKCTDSYMELNFINDITDRRDLREKRIYAHNVRTVHMLSRSVEELGPFKNYSVEYKIELVRKKWFFPIWPPLSIYLRNIIISDAS